MDGCVRIYALYWAFLVLTDLTCNNGRGSADSVSWRPIGCIGGESRTELPPAWIDRFGQTHNPQQQRCIRRLCDAKKRKVQYPLSSGVLHVYI